VDATDVKVIGEIAHQLKFSIGVLGVKALDEKLSWLQQEAPGTGTQDVDYFILRSRRLQVKLATLVAQAEVLRHQFSEGSTGNT
jgi:hypothetical protein